MAEHLLAVGTYTSRHPFGSRVGRAVRNILAAGKPRAAGIYLVSFDADRARFGEPSPAAAIANPSWLARHPAQNVLYAVSESAPGSITTYRVRNATLEKAGSLPTMGDAPCYVGVDPGGRFLLAANYASGSVAVIEIRPDGTVGGRSDIRVHKGSGPNRQRQERAHPHSACVSPSGNWVLVPDLGADAIFVYALDPEIGLVPAATPSYASAPGAGPRHMVFHPDGRTALLVNELDSTLASYSFDEISGRLEHIHTVSMLPATESKRSTAADVVAHPNGKLAFVSIRGFDSIASIAIAETGRMELIAIGRTDGRTPRGIAMEPAGGFLMAAHQDSDEVIAFAIGEQRGALEVVDRARIPTCACVRFL